VVVGGGIIGLATAYRFARAAWRVTLVDPSPARGATWAAAGMLAPSAELLPGEEENLNQQRRAVAEWQTLSDELAELVGRGPTITLRGTLLVGWDASDRALAAQFAHVAREANVEVRVVRREDEPELFAEVSPRVVEGYLFDGDGWIDPDDAVATLLSANQQLGVDVVPETVRRVESSTDGVVAIGDSIKIHADYGVLTTGAQPLPEGAKGRHVVRPIRGITTRLTGLDRSRQPTLRAYVRGRSFYLVSRPDAYCVIGATAEERPEARVEFGELARLMRDALEIVPGLDGAEYLETRYGLRPVSTDLDPFIELLDDGRWIWASGHYRHGVTMAPLASSAIYSFVSQLS
jgi:glycine oxidase